MEGGPRAGVLAHCPSSGPCSGGETGPSCARSKADLLWPSGPRRAPGPALCSSPQGLSRRLSEVSCVPGLPPSLMGPPAMPLPLLGQEGRDTARSLWTVPRHDPSDQARQGSGRHSPGGDGPQRAYAVMQQGETLPRALGRPGQCSMGLLTSGCEVKPHAGYRDDFKKHEVFKNIYCPEGVHEALTVSG